MSPRIDQRRTIASALNAFEHLKVSDAARQLFATLGYESDRTLELEDSSPRAFLDFIHSHPGGVNFDEAKALVPDWKSADLLFQLTDEELSNNASLFKETAVQPSLLRSYVFFAIELSGEHYARGRLTDIARQINRVFPMPVMVLIKHRSDQRSVLSLAVINRRQSKRDASRDVLGKVTIIHNIDLVAPHRGHIEILASFALPNLAHPQRLPINNFDTLHAAWEEIFNVELLNNRFYRELANWYFWALSKVDFPCDIEKDDERRRATSLIRLLTRLIFCWFLKEKDLIPEKLFNEAELQEILVTLDPDACTYYQAILQNLFFATLNQRMGKDKDGVPFRSFARDEDPRKGRTNDRADTLYRYGEHFLDPSTALDHFADVPFLNGGLFECLDRIDEATGRKLYLDGFSQQSENRPTVPNYLFFAKEQVADLSDAYGEPKRRSEKVRGLLRILHSYKFTIVENTPIDQEIALDPELLGKVFENLLASYNEETRTTARKQTGSFYTPRSIVEFMVDEALKAHLTKALLNSGMGSNEARVGLDILFAYTEREHPFTDREADIILEAIHGCKILDPACGSGAFPMGMLQKLVYIIHKLDPNNAKWMQLQIDAAASIPDASAREAAIEAIEHDFKENEDDFGRKLYLIENCLYGVDIQPIAIQISKLRFFISLICDQRTSRRRKDNYGIRPLPNLETKFVAADTLMGLTSNQQFDLDLFANPVVKRLEAELQRVRHDYFAAATRQRKLALQRRDRELRSLIANNLVQASFGDQAASLRVAAWDPYDPQRTADFFDPLWMFDQSVADGFDILIGNPPYISVERFAGTAIQAAWQKAFETYAARGDIYCFFYERGAALLRPGGTLVYITSNKWMRMGYGERLRNFLSSRVKVHSVLDFGMAQNFGAATTYTCITRLSADDPDGTLMSCYATDDLAAMADPAGYFESNAVRQSSVNSDPWVVLPRSRQRIKELVEVQGVPLKRWGVDINYGLKTGFNEAFYIDARQRQQLIDSDPASEELIGKLLRGRDLERYKVNWDDTYQLIVKFGAYEYLEDRYPAVFHHLKRFEAQLKARGQCKYGRERKVRDAAKPYPGQHHWLELDNNPGDSYLQLFHQPKIIYQDIAQSLPFYFDSEDNFFFNNTLWMMNGDASLLPYLTGLLNSSVFRCCFRDNFPEYSGNAYRLFASFMAKIPLKKPTPGHAALFAKLIPMVQLAKRVGDEAPAQFFEDLIDACIMECYFREHMAERKLLFLDDLGPHLSKFDPNNADLEQREVLAHLYRTLNASDATVRNRLLRLSADSPDLLAVIKEEGRI